MKLRLSDAILPLSWSMVVFVCSYEYFHAPPKPAPDPELVNLWQKADDQHAQAVKDGVIK